ncbi:MAG: hypothetical protein CO108_30225 [Deltaproteobacteria bacterium CG_4_9_14_3_um_filter_63_12]|nr:MAG: hypothetical protein CO108_30225 [Deltaproteobacteria bacterium CG_4_9_14_3_um_filter_63_12]
MAFESFVGLRYLMAKRQRNVLSVITLISIGGVAVGVMALIVVLSVMGGFEGDLREKIVGAKAHIVIEAKEGYLSNYEELLTRLEGVDGIIGASPYLEGEVMINSASNHQGVVLRGIDPKLIKGVSNLESVMEEGGLEYLHDPSTLPKRSYREDQNERFGELSEFVLQQDGGDDATSDTEKALMRAAGAKASIAFAGGDHGRFINEAVSRAHVRRDKKSALEKADGPDDEDVVGDDEESAPDGVDKVDDDDADADSEAKEADTSGEGDVWLDDSAASRKPREMGTVRVSKSSLGPQSRKMGPIKGVEQGPEDRVVGGIILGRELKTALSVFLGHEVNIMSPMGDLSPAGSMPKSRPYRIVGVFFSGMYEYDTKLVYMMLPDAQKFLNTGHRVSGIEVKVDSLERTVELRHVVEDLMADRDDVVVKDWRELNGNLFSALMLEKIAMFVILTFIILVASFNIVCLLIMIVIEKGREIAIIKSMGASNLSVMGIFLLQGGVIGLLGTLLGGLAGLGLCWVIGGWGIELPADVYYLSHVPVEVRAIEVLLISGSAVVISLLATIPPAILAARLDPVVGLRYE